MEFAFSVVMLLEGWCVCVVSGGRFMCLSCLVVCWCVCVVSDGVLVYMWYLVACCCICVVLGVILVYLWCLIEGWCVRGGVWWNVAVSVVCDSVLCLCSIWGKLVYLYGVW